ncbi:MAG: protein-export chaperone SecB [Lachnospiraceae bacterium]|nr:protein-export chaperone SecB [Lachnospiraceae bacterium]
MEKNVKSVLNMERLLFDRISFERLGFKNENELVYNLNVSIMQKQNEDVYKVTLKLKANKEKEYLVELELTGYFIIESDEGLTEEIKSSLINQNAVAIMMPYLRSQLSLITAQPDVECVVMPPLNIAGLMSDED